MTYIEVDTTLNKSPRFSTITLRKAPLLVPVVEGVPVVEAGMLAVVEVEVVVEDEEDVLLEVS